MNKTKKIELIVFFIVVFQIFLLLNTFFADSYIIQQTIFQNETAIEKKK